MNNIRLLVAIFPIMLYLAVFLGNRMIYHHSKNDKAISKVYIFGGFFAVIIGLSLGMGWWSMLLFFVDEMFWDGTFTRVVIKNEGED